MAGTIELLFNSEYQRVKSRYNTIEKIRRDLMDDSSGVRKINGLIDDIYEDFTEFTLETDVRRRVATKLDSLKEPHQSVDSLLNQADQRLENESSLARRSMRSMEES